jgi:hypothetical protein
MTSYRATKQSSSVDKLIWNIREIIAELALNIGPAA